MEAEIGQLRAQLLHKDQENERVQLQLQEEKEERERAQRKVQACAQLSPRCLVGYVKLTAAISKRCRDWSSFVASACLDPACVRLQLAINVMRGPSS